MYFYTTISDPFRICFERGLLLLCASCVVYYIYIHIGILYSVNIHSTRPLYSQQEVVFSLTRAMQVRA